MLCIVVLKSAESYAHMMILAILPYLTWKISKVKGDQAAPLIAKWFKLAARAQAVNAYWDPCNECMKNVSDKMLEMANTDMDDLYWALDVVVPSPKCKRNQVDEESLDNSVSMVKMAISQKNKTLKSALKTSPLTTGTRVGDKTQDKI